MAEVTSADRKAFERQRTALSHHDNHGEDPVWEQALQRVEDERRAQLGEPALEPWWSTKTEQELHRRARALGLLRRDR